MKLTKISFKNYKVLSDHEFLFDNGLRFIARPNEFGKSTIIEGILDVFSLSPQILVQKTTKGQGIPPVIKLNFLIEDHEYELKLSGLEKRPYFRGTDGIDLESPDSIKKFLEKKGYKHFRQVLEGLLVLRERDLSVAGNRGLREVFDKVLKSASIEGLERRIRDDFILQKCGLRQNPFGRMKQEVQEKLENINQELLRLEREKEEFEKNKKRLEVVKEKLEKLKANQKKLSHQKEQLGYLQAYLEIEYLENKLQKLKEEEKTLTAKIKKIEAEKETIKKELEALGEKERKLISQLAQKNFINREIRLLKDKLKQLHQEFTKQQEYQKLKENLGPLANQNPEKLQDYLNEWRTFLKMASLSRGKIEILNAGNTILINGKEVSSRNIEFQGKVNLKYQDLELNIYPQVKLADLSKKITHLEKEFLTPENLLQTIQKLRKLKQLETSLEEELNLPPLKNKIEETQKEIENLKENQKKVVQQEKLAKEIRNQIKTLEQKRRNLEEKYLALKEELSAKKTEIKNLETKIKDYPRDFEEGLSLKTIKAYQGHSLKNISNLLNQVAQNLERTEAEIIKLDKEKDLYEDRVARKPDLARYEELLDEKKILERQLLRFKRLEAVLRTSADILARLKERINQAYLEKFENKVAEIFKEITEGRYISVRFNFPSLFFDREAFKRDWVAINQEGKAFPIDSLSDGTKVQLLLAARLALVELFFEHKAFFLLDEPLAYFDENRAKRTLNILNSLADSGWQIIIMSARPFET